MKGDWVAVCVHVRPFLPAPKVYLGLPDVSQRDLHLSIKLKRVGDRTLSLCGSFPYAMIASANHRPDYLSI
jgi:hypothetical protein